MAEPSNEEEEGAAPPPQAPKPRTAVARTPRAPVLAYDWEAEMAKHAQATAEAESNVVTSRFFSVRGGILTFDGTPLQDNSANVIILDSIFSHEYYENAFDPDNTEVPVCFSFSDTGLNMEPHEASHAPRLLCGVPSATR